MSAPRDPPKDRSLRSAIRDCVDLTLRLRKTRPVAHVELEVRRGRVDAGRFVAGVDAGSHAASIEYMESFDAWSESVPWQQTTDYFFDAGGESARQTVSVDLGSYTIDDRPAVVKTTLLSFVFETDASHDAIKLSVATEQPLPDPPKIVRPSWVRQKYRRSFLLRQGRFDFTIVRAGKDKAQLGPYTYEAELEFVADVDGSDCADHLVHDIRQLCASGIVVSAVGAAAGAAASGPGEADDEPGPFVMVSRSASRDIDAEDQTRMK